MNTDGTRQAAGGAGGLDLQEIGRDLRARGRRLTRLKRDVLLTLARERFATADDLGGHLGVEGDLSPLYRCLSSLEEAGIVTHVYLSEDSRRYVLREPYGDHHDFLVCMNCSTIEELECCLDDDLAGRISGRGFEIQDHQVVLRGVCASCRSEER